LRRVLWHPALAYAALLVILLLPTFRTRFDDAAGRRDFAHPPDGVPAPAAPVPASATKPQQGVDAAAPREREAAPRDLVKSERHAEARAVLPDQARDETRSRAQEEPHAVQPAARQPMAAVAPPAAPPAGGAASQPSSRADVGTSMRLGGASAGRRTLVVTLPSSVVAGGAVEVRVRSASGDRELRDQVRPAPDGRELTLELPSGWLGEPPYVVEIYDDGALLTHGNVGTR
jgi:hypothetical protein